jgi:hypothetical protein
MATSSRVACFVLSYSISMSGKFMNSRALKGRDGSDAGLDALLVGYTATLCWTH